MPLLSSHMWTGDAFTFQCIECDHSASPTTFRTGLADWITIRPPNDYKCIYTCTFVWSSKIQLQSVHKKQIFSARCNRGQNLKTKTGRIISTSLVLYWRHWKYFIISFSLLAHKIRFNNQPNSALVTHLPKETFRVLYRICFYLLRAAFWGFKPMPVLITFHFFLCHSFAH